MLWNIISRSSSDKCPQNVDKIQIAKINGLCKKISEIGPNAPLEDLKQLIVSSSAEFLDTDFVGLFTIDQFFGGIKYVGTESISEEIASAFIENYSELLVDRDQTDSIVDSSISTISVFKKQSIISIIICPIRSQVGISGALVAFYKSTIDKPEEIKDFGNVLGSIIASVMSYAMTIDQSGQILDDLAGANQKLELQATVDGLTGLMNHRSMQQSLSELCRVSGNKKKREVCIAMVDVDYFKMYNDTHGHREGDAALQAVAKLIAAGLRQGDIAARYGGEEFALVFQGVNKETAFTICERIRRSIANHQFRKASLTVSMGIAEFPVDGSTPAEIIEYADRALYHAKITGRNRIVIWGQSSGSTVNDDNIDEKALDNAPKTVLVIDDSGLDSIKEALSSQQYVIETVNSTSEAIDLLRTRLYDILLISASSLPERNVKSLIPISAIHPDMPVVLMVDESPAEISREALRSGASDILIRPFSSGELPVIIERNLERRRLECKRLADKSTTIMLQAIEALVAAIDAKDHYTVGHSQRVTAISLAIADKLNIPSDERYTLELAARIHDIGKIGLPDSALNKQSPLNEAEWNAIRQHPVLGSKIVGSIDELAYVSTIIRHHHERLDGTGYPDGLNDVAIPYLARIIAVADTYEAMTSERSYRSRISPKDVIEELRLNSGTYYDPDIIQALENHLVDTGEMLPNKKNAA